MTSPPVHNRPSPLAPAYESHEARRPQSWPSVPGGLVSCPRFGHPPKSCPVTKAFDLKRTSNRTKRRKFLLPPSVSSYRPGSAGYAGDGRGERTTEKARGQQRGERTTEKARGQQRGERTSRRGRREARGQQRSRRGGPRRRGGPGFLGAPSRLPLGRPLAGQWDWAQCRGTLAGFPTRALPSLRRLPGGGVRLLPLHLLSAWAMLSVPRRRPACGAAGCPPR
jgi:hypothetical protein